MVVHKRILPLKENNYHRFNNMRAEFDGGIRTKNAERQLNASGSGPRGHDNTIVTPRPLAKLWVNSKHVDLY